MFHIINIVIGAPLIAIASFILRWRLRLFRWYLKKAKGKLYRGSAQSYKFEEWFAETKPELQNRLAVSFHLFDVFYNDIIYAKNYLELEGIIDEILKRIPAEIKSKRFLPEFKKAIKTMKLAVTFAAPLSSAIKAKAVMQKSESSEGSGINPIIQMATTKNSIDVSELADISGAEVTVHLPDENLVLHREGEPDLKTELENFKKNLSSSSYLDEVQLSFAFILIQYGLEEYEGAVLDAKTIDDLKNLVDQILNNQIS